MGAQVSISARDLREPCTRCGATDHAFVDCKRDPPETGLIAALESIALELKIANLREDLKVSIHGLVERATREGVSPESLDSPAFKAFFEAVESRK